MDSSMTSWHVGVAAEAIAAAQFARCGYYVSVQYGANQPEYDLICEADGLMLKISVKGSQDGSWGLAQGLKKNHTYHEAVNLWLDKHHEKTIFCLVQFNNVKVNEIPRIYLATPEEIAVKMKEAAKGRGDTILYENHKWTKRAVGAGTTEKIPEEWAFSPERVKNMFELYGK